jgi:hypothetical protein
LFHDLAGWLMMPLALGLLWLELMLLSALLAEPVPARPIPLDLNLGQVRPDSAHFPETP